MSTDVHTLSGAYALHALSVREEAEFESHLEGCASCRAETDEFRAVTAALGELEQREVPASLRAAVMRGVDQQRQLPPLVPVVRHEPADAHGVGVPGDGPDGPDGHEGGDGQAAGPGPDAGAAGAESRVVSRPSLGRWRRGRRPEAHAEDPARWRRGLVADAAAVVLVGGGAVVASSMDDPGMSVAASQVFSASDAHTLEVSVPGDGFLQLATSPSTGQMAVDARQMPELPDGRTYQLWLLQDGVASSVGVVDRGSATMPLPEPGTELAVTVEPAGGSEQPTTDPLTQVDPTSI